MDARPLPAPAMGRYALRSLVDDRSALHFAPARLPGLAPWLLRFWLNCNTKAYYRGWDALARLGQATLPLVDAMSADGIAFDLFRSGLVHATSDPNRARAALSELEPLREYGYSVPTDVLRGPELRALEPALSASMDAGFLIEDHWHVQPYTFSQGLAKALRARGAEVVENTTVSDFAMTDRRIRAARTNGGDVEGDVFVVAAGVWSARVASRLGVKVRLQAGKGYSFSVYPTVVPQHAIDLADIHVGCSPFHESMRVTGIMEFDGLNRRMRDRRLRRLVVGTRRSFLPWPRSVIHDTWTGLRPITADGLPIIDACGSNAFLATGHAMLGIHLAPPTGATLAEFILTGQRPRVLDPFQLARFGAQRRHHNS